MNPIFQEELVRKEAASSLISTFKDGKFAKDDVLENFRKVVIKDPDFYELTSIFDIDHPEFGNVAKEKIKNKSTFSQEEKKEIIDIIKKESMPRLFKSKEQRDFRRKNKGICSVSMRKVCVFGENGFPLFPSSFSGFYRHSTCQSNDSRSLKAMAENFASYGLKLLSEASNKYAKIIDLNNTTEEWCSFKRIQPYVAAIILAKLHNFKWDNLTTISRPAETLREFACEDMPEVPKNKKIEIFGNLSYYPKIYSVHTLEDLPNTFKDVMQYCDSLPEMNSKPAFDYYWALLPGFSLNHSSFYTYEGLYRININGKKIESKKEQEVSSVIDKHLLSKNLIHPCLLGERDGKCYLLLA